MNHSRNKVLVIAEKPSQASDFARALGAKKAVTKDYFENEEYVITSAIGHLLEICDPDELETCEPDEERPGVGENKSDKVKLRAKKRIRWGFRNLPRIPPHFALNPIDEKSVGRLKLIVKLAERDYIGSMINACDAGREGELIFRFIKRYLVEYVGVSDKHIQVKRLWLRSMTPEAIHDGFKKLRDPSRFDNLAEAAEARSEADWLVGTNITSALRKHVGRVQTPTLSLLVDRELERDAHKPRDYWNLEVTFAAGAGEYKARWVGEQPDTIDGRDARRDRIWDEAQAQSLLGQSSKGAVGHASDKSRERKKAPPRLYDLNGLLRDANKLHSLPARATQGAAQALYERHKLLTYPRTESSFLPNDYKDFCEETLESLSGATGSLADVARITNVAIRRVKDVGNRVFDDAKVSDHFAIIPTGTLPNEPLLDNERKVYELVVRRFVAAFLPTALELETVRITMIDGEKFEAKGRVVVETGWLAVAKGKGKDVDLPPLNAASEQVSSMSAKLEQKVTRPPQRYDDASLLGAMQGAYRFVEEDDLAENLKAGGGLGTPATRAGIIEKLIERKRGYVGRCKCDKKGFLIPFPKGKYLIEKLGLIGLDELTKPELTGEWEGRLNAIEEGKDSKDAFLEDIKKFIIQAVVEIRDFDPDNPDGTDLLALSGGCPVCGGIMREGYLRYSCQDCGFFFWRTQGNRKMSAAEAEQLLDKGRSGPFDDFKK